jgi:type II secretion system (T2SS) protein E
LLATVPAQEHTKERSTTVESGHVVRLGDLLIQEKLVTQEQIDEALRVQSTLKTYVPLGQILMMRGWLTRTQLTTVLRRHRKRARLGEMLVRTKRITEAQLETALAQQKQMRQPLGRVLMSLGYLTEETMREALCAQLHINFFDLDRVMIDPGLATMVTEKYAVRRRVVPLFRADRILVVGVDDPTDVAVVEDLQHLVRLRVEVVTSTTEKLLRAIKRLYVDGSQANFDPCIHHNIMIGAVHDQEVADLAVKVLKVRILPPYWQQGS